MHYDFIEIGTSDFDTLIENASDTDIGLSVDPMQIYLDRLPDKDGVTKVCCGIGTDTKELPLYYISPKSIELLNLPYYIRGCNSIGERHSKHYGLEEYVEVSFVPVIPLEELLSDHGVTSVDLIKIDCEGMDLDVLTGIVRSIRLGHIPPPSIIKFECYISDVNKPPYCDKESFDRIVDEFKSIGYRSPINYGNNFELRLQ